MSQRTVLPEYILCSVRTEMNNFNEDWVRIATYTWLNFRSMSFSFPSPWKTLNVVCSAVSICESVTVIEEHQDHRWGGDGENVISRTKHAMPRITRTSTSITSPGIQGTECAMCYGIHLILSSGIETGLDELSLGHKYPGICPVRSHQHGRYSTSRISTW